MIPLLPAMLAIGVSAATLTGRRRASKRHLKHQKTGNSAGLSADSRTGKIVSVGVGWLDGYHLLVQRRLDPLLMGRGRAHELKKAAGGKERALSVAERRANLDLLGALGVGTLLGLSALTAWPLAPFIIALATWTLLPVLSECWRLAVKEKRLSILHLVAIYLAFLWLGGYFAVGALSLMIFAITEKLQILTQITVRNDITQLLGDQPERVFVLHDGVEVEIRFQELKIGDILVVGAGQTIPVDGEVVGGEASVDQHRLTGEYQPVDKALGDLVNAATLVVAGRIEVCVQQTGQETMAGRIAEVLEHTVEREEIRIADQYRLIEHTRTPMLAAGALGWLLGGPITGVALLGCNYQISMVSLRLITLLHGLQAGIASGLLIKDGRVLERLPEIDTVIFDKTGTLTAEKPVICRIHAWGASSIEEVLKFAAAAEQRQTHPIAEAIRAEAESRNLPLPQVGEGEYAVGLGLIVQIEGRRILVGSERFLRRQGVEFSPDSLSGREQARQAGHSLVHVAVDGALFGAIELEARLRTGAKELVDWLKQRGLKVFIVSGDQEAPTRSLANTLGLDGYYSDILPEQKAEKVVSLQAGGHGVCFVGDGINDAIALRQADASISLRGATRIATDAAQVVLLDDDLDQLKTLWSLAAGFRDNLHRNTRIATRFSLLAGSAALVFPFKFLIVELTWLVQFSVGLHTANRSLLAKEKPFGGSSDSPQKKACLEESANG